MAILCRTNARLGRLRGGAERGGDPVPGRRADGPPGRATARSKAARAAAAGRACAAWPATRDCSTRSGRVWASARSTRQTDLARLVKLAEAFDGTADEFTAYLRGALRRMRHASRRPPPHLPPSQGARVRHGLPPEARGEGAAVEAREDPRRVGRGAPAPLRRPHAGQEAPQRHLVRQAQPLPRRARPARARRRGQRSPTTRSTRRSRRGAWRLREGRGEARVRDLPQLDARPRSSARRRGREQELAAVPGVGPAKLERYGRRGASRASAS